MLGLCGADFSSMGAGPGSGFSSAGRCVSRGKAGGWSDGLGAPAWAGVGVALSVEGAGVTEVLTGAGQEVIGTKQGSTATRQTTVRGR